MGEYSLQQLSRAKPRTVCLKLISINEGYREKINALHTGTGFSRNFVKALWNIRGSYIDYSICL